MKSWDLDVIVDEKNATNQSKQPWTIRMYGAQCLQDFIFREAGHRPRLQVLRVQQVQRVQPNTSMQALQGGAPQS